MQTTAFNQIHKQLGAKMVEFAGFEMPIEYSGIKDEHMTVREGVGVFDVSHMGEIWVKGPNALDLVQRITTNDVAKLTRAGAIFLLSLMAKAELLTICWFTTMGPTNTCWLWTPPTSTKTGIGLFRKIPAAQYSKMRRQQSVS